MYESHFRCGKFEYDKKVTGTSSYHDDFRETLALLKGVNYIFFECWHDSVNAGGSVKVSFAPIVA